MPRKNHWWNITLFVNPKGISTQTISNGSDSFEIQFNFINHTLEVFSSTGQSGAFELYDGLTVADFYNKLLETLTRLHIDIKIVDHPYSLPDEHPMTTPFNQITEYHSYDKEYINRYWKIILWVNNVLTNFSGRYYGKTCPVHIYWHHMDLTVTRFSGKKLPLPEGMSIPNKDAYSHEVISFGFWVGDEKVPAPAFYSYTYPSPEGLQHTPLKPAAASWQMSNGSPMALLMYDDIRNEADPEQLLLDFLESAYSAGAKLAHWNIEDLKVPALDEL